MEYEVGDKAVEMKGREWKGGEEEKERMFLDGEFKAGLVTARETSS